MNPRKYTLGKRAHDVARTRARIVEAAMGLYGEQPIDSTSMQEVARRADVSPATVLNHFETQDALAEAVVEELFRTLKAPSPAIFEGVETVGERLTVLAKALARFFERAEPWFKVHERDQGCVPAFERAAHEFDEGLVALIREALGAWGGEERKVLAVRALLSPPVVGGLREKGGMTAEGAADLVSEILKVWLGTHSGAEAQT